MKTRIAVLLLRNTRKTECGASRFLARLAVRTAPFALLIALALTANEGATPVTVHEWGTFTSVADANGDPVTWAPLSGLPDLPCFVHSLPQMKPFLAGRVRMETPVIYFYARRPTTLSVRVDFPQGWVTEWYPQATANLYPGNAMPVANGRTEWNRVDVLPGADSAFPAGQGASHYYAARETDAAPLRIGTEQEKFIFYRGVGDFDIPVHPRFTGAGALEIRNAGKTPIPVAILFENRGGHMGFRVAHDLRDSATLAPPELTADLDAIRAQLVADLREAGLYKKEALAMVETWRDSWFEEGMRVMYLMPRATVDTVLPLNVTPAPSAVERVFVGRVEVLSPATRGLIEAALAAKNDAPLVKMGRFLTPFLQQMKRDREPMLARLNSVWPQTAATSCIK